MEGSDAGMIESTVAQRSKASCSRESFGMLHVEGGTKSINHFEQTTVLHRVTG
jgi:hypothetical protein